MHRLVMSTLCLLRGHSAGLSIPQVAGSLGLSRYKAWRLLCHGQDQGFFQEARRRHNRGFWTADGPAAATAFAELSRLSKLPDRIDLPNESDEAPVSHQFDAMRARITADDEHWLASMSYDDFRATQYWKIVSAYRIHLAGNQCEVCGVVGRVFGKYIRGARTLHTHHKTYAHRGSEFRHLADLAILCGDCHGKIHNRKNAA